MKIPSNFRIEVIPYAGYIRNEPNEKDARELLEAIKRHTDNDGATILYDYVCSFCGSDWKNSLDENGCPICCDEAVKEFEKNKSAEKEYKALLHKEKG